MSIQADFILVVEKDTVFRKLVQEQFPAWARCVMITGRGVPDLATRQFLAVLHAKFPLPMLCLTDADFFGHRIFTTYKYGSPALLHERVALTSLRWIGLSVLDVESLHLEQQALPLTPRDQRLIEKFTTESQLAVKEPITANEMQLMLQRGFKAELEVLLTKDDRAFSPWIGLLIKRYYEELQDL